MRDSENSGNVEIEAALQRLMPVGLSEFSHTETSAMLDDLCGDSYIFASHRGKTQRARLWWLVSGSIAAVLVLALSSVFSPHGNKTTASSRILGSGAVTTPKLVFLTGSDRVEGVEDDGLYVDSGGSAVRKVRFRVVEESSIRDEETGIIVQLTEPREEMFLVPVSTF